MHPRLAQLLERHGTSVSLPPALLADMDRLVASLERERAISEHAFRVSERTYQDVLASLRSESAARENAITEIRTAIALLVGLPGGDAAIPDGDLGASLQLLKRAVQRSKELETELVSARETADLAARAKSEFLAMVSHDIRTPLSVIVGTVYLLEVEATPQMAELITPLRSACNTLLGLVNDLLDMRQIEEGQVQFEQRLFNLHQLLGIAGDAARRAGAARGTTVDLSMGEDLPVQIVGDAHRLTQVINNLLSNAVKFAEGGRVRLTAELLAQEQGRASIRFSVQDNGIGISPEQQSVIFERFTQAHAGIRREFGGSGLGLAIIKRLLNLQGSDIKVVSTPGIGSTFTFDLPFGVSGAVEAEHQPRLQIDLQGRSILLVDDQTDLGEIMAAMLRKLNLQVTSVRSGADALKVLDKNAEFGLVLMDLQMPGMDGYETAYEIRRLRPLMPIVAMTAGVRNDTVERVLQHGMDALVRKPLDLELLVPLLKQHLKVP
jgi:signal transduction histidine kinase